MKNSSLASLIGMAVSGAARLLLLIYVGRTLGDQALNQVTEILTIAVLVGLAWPTSAGVLYSMYRRRKANHQPFRQIANWLYSRVLIFVLASFASFVLIFFIQLNNFTFSLLGAGLISFYGLYTFFRPIFISDFKYSRSLVFEFIGGTAGVLTGWILAPALGITGVLIGYCVMFGSFLFGAQLKSRLSFEWIPPKSSKLFKQGIWISTSQLATNASVSLALLLIIWLEPLVQFSAYASAAFSLATPITMIGTALAQSAVPHLSSQQNTFFFRKELRRIISWFIPTVLCLFTLLAFIGPLLTSVIYLMEWLNPFFFPLIAAGLLMFTLNILYSAAVNALHQPRKVLEAFLVGLAIGAISFSIAIQSLSPFIASPIAFLVTGLTTWVVLFRAVEKLTKK